MNKAILLVIIQLFLTQVFAQGQIGGIIKDDLAELDRDDKNEKEKKEPDSEINVQAVLLDEFIKLEKLTIKFIKTIESRYAKCNKVKISLKDFNDLYVQLAGQNLKLLTSEVYQKHEALHCKGTQISDRDKIYHCLLKGKSKKLLGQILSSKIFPQFLKIRLKLKDSEVKETIRFFESLL